MRDFQTLVIVVPNDVAYIVRSQAENFDAVIYDTKDDGHETEFTIKIPSARAAETAFSMGALMGEELLKHKRLFDKWVVKSA